MEDRKLKYQKIILIMIMVIIIAIVVIVGIIYGINKNNKTNDTQNNEDEIRNLEESGEEYDQEHLNNFDFKVISLDTITQSKIQNINQFLMDMKEYIYINGFVQASSAECINVKETVKTIIIEFQLNNPERTVISANINLDDGTYTFSDNY